MEKVYQPTQNHELLKKMLEFELKMKVESKQLRNLDFRSIKKDDNTDFHLERIVNLAKD